jgi:predicted Zn-dependent protease
MNHKKLANGFLLSLAALMFIVQASDAEASRKQRSARNENYSQADRQMDRLRYVMLPLLRVANHRVPLDQVRVSIVEESAINAAAGGDGRYYVTTGLLNQANDDQLRGVLAHEIAHEDLGHPAKAQVVGVGVGLGAALLEKIFPGSVAIAPVAGTLISNNYSRPMELDADRHAVTLLKRAGYSKYTMIDALSWLMRRNGDSGGGFLASHPATSDRIKALQSLR